MSIDLLPWHAVPLRDLLSRREKLPHAMLVYGRHGIGKVEFARAMVAESSGAPAAGRASTNTAAKLSATSDMRARDCRACATRDRGLANAALARSVGLSTACGGVPAD